MYKLQNNSIKRLSDGASIPLADGNMDYEEYKQWILEGGIPEPQYTEAEILAKTKAEISSAIQSMLDAKARELRYDNINSIAKYIGYDNPFRTEAEALGLWCASCWAELAIIEEEVESGERVLPSLEEILAELPEFSV